MTIQERRIYDLKKKNQELEKFKFVLDYKIKELKKQIEPREEEIRRMKDQIQEVGFVSYDVDLLLLKLARSILCEIIVGCYGFRSTREWQYHFYLWRAWCLTTTWLVLNLFV